MNWKEKLVGILTPMIIDVVRDAVKDKITPEAWAEVKAKIKEKTLVYGDKIFDAAERAIKKSETKFDDKLFLPIIEDMRKVMGIPDLPDD